MEQALELAGDADPVEREMLYWEPARLRSFGDPDRSVEILERAVSLFDEDADPKARITPSRSHSAMPYGQRSLRPGGGCAGRPDPARRPGSRCPVAAALHRAQWAPEPGAGRGDQAIDHAARAVEDYREAGFEYGLADALPVLRPRAAGRRPDRGGRRALEEARALASTEAERGRRRFPAHRRGPLPPAAGRARTGHRERPRGDRPPGRPVDGRRAGRRLPSAGPCLRRPGGAEQRRPRLSGTAIDLLRRQRGWYRELSKAYRWYGKFLRRTGRTEAAMEMLERAGDISLRLQEMLER